jgi:hypothetical protein
MQLQVICNNLDDANRHQTGVRWPVPEQTPVDVQCRKSMMTLGK